MSANFVLLLDGIFILLTPVKMLVSPSGGGLDKVMMCSKVSVLKIRIMPSEHAQKRRPSDTEQPKARSTLRFIHFSSLRCLS